MYACLITSRQALGPWTSRQRAKDDRDNKLMLDTCLDGIWRLTTFTSLEKEKQRMLCNRKYGPE